MLKNSKELRDGDKVKLYNKVGQATPPCAVFTFRLSNISPIALAVTADAGARIASAAETEDVQEKAISETAATGDGAFSSQLLADVLCAALDTKLEMKALVQAVKAKRKEAFKSVQLSSKADGLYSNIQIAERIAECKPDQVTDAQELLDWLIKVRDVVTCA